MRILTAVLAACACTAVLAAEPAAPAFTKKPIATRDGDQVKIEFAVNRETDVAVYVENAKGEIIRHLVAGVLGKNPPEPLKASSLKQLIIWDRKDDDGKAASGGPFAEPEIAFAWIVGLAVTDKYAYVDDVINKRVLRVKLDYTATETVLAP